MMPRKPLHTDHRAIMFVRKIEVGIGLHRIPFNCHGNGSIRVITKREREKEEMEKCHLTDRATVGLTHFRRHRGNSELHNIVSVLSFAFSRSALKSEEDKNEKRKASHATQKKKQHPRTLELIQRERHLQAQPNRTRLARLQTGHLPLQELRASMAWRRLSLWTRKKKRQHLTVWRRRKKAVSLLVGTTVRGRPPPAASLLSGSRRRLQRLSPW